MKKSYLLLSSLVLTQLAHGADMTATATAPNPSAVKFNSGATLESGNSLSQGSLKKTERSTGFMELSLGLKKEKLSAAYITRLSLGDRGPEAEQKYFLGRNELQATYAIAGSDALSLTGIAKLNLGEQDNVSLAGSQRLGLSLDSTKEISTVIGKVTPYGGVAAFAQRTKRVTTVDGAAGLTSAEKENLSINTNSETGNNEATATNVAPRMEYTLGTTLVPSVASKLTLGAEIFVRRQYNPVYTLTDNNDAFKVDHFASASQFSYLEISGSFAATDAVSVYSKVGMDITTAKNKVLLKKTTDAANVPNPISVALGVSATIL